MWVNVDRAVAEVAWSLCKFGSKISNEKSGFGIGGAVIGCSVTGETFWLNMLR